MKKFFFLLAFSIYALPGVAQQDTSLSRRLHAVIDATRIQDLEKVMDYTYPKIFEYATRAQLIAAMKGVFETDEFSTELDSTRVTNIFPVFSIKDGNYAKVRFTMLMKMKYKEPIDTSDKEEMKSFIHLMEEQFGKGNVRYDIPANALVIFMISDMIAVKDKLSPAWTFLNLDESKTKFFEMLLGKEVMTKLNEYN